MKSSNEVRRVQVSVLVSLVLAAAASRLLPHAPNFGPVAAIALFSGVQFTRARQAYLVPLLAMLVSDAIIGFHSTVPFVYAGLLFTTFLGQQIQAKAGIPRVLGASVLSTAVFFLLTNLGVWLVGGMYPMTAQGLAVCYWAAIPFLGNSLVGDLFFVGALFGSLHLIRTYVPSLRAAPQPS